MHIAASRIISFIIFSEKRARDLVFAAGRLIDGLSSCGLRLGPLMSSETELPYLIMLSFGGHSTACLVPASCR
jgi:hypothetical protein